MTVIVALYGSVRSLVLVISVRGYENRSHHRKGTEGGGYHVAHDIAVVVLAGPDKAALCFHDAGNGVIDQSVEVGNACFCKFLFVLCIEDLLEDILEAVIVSLLANHRSCFVDSAYSKQLLAKLSMELSRLCMP